MPWRGQFATNIWMVLAGASMLWFVAHKLHYLSDYSQVSYSDYFWPRRAGLIMHLSGGFSAITAGLAQLWLGLTGRTGSLHRMLGRFYVLSVIVGFSGATYMALTIPGHAAYSAGLLGMNAAWLLTTGMAVRAIRQRVVSQHRAWAIRNYIVTFAFVTYRLGSNILGPLVVVTADPVATVIDTYLAWGAWVVPLAIAEIVTRSAAVGGLARQTS